MNFHYPYYPLCPQESQSIFNLLIYIPYRPSCQLPHKTYRIPLLPAWFLIRPAERFIYLIYTYLCDARPALTIAFTKQLITWHFSCACRLSWQDGPYACNIETIVYFNLFDITPIRAIRPATPMNYQIPQFVWYYIFPPLATDNSITYFIFIDILLIRFWHTSFLRPYLISFSLIYTDRYVPAFPVERAEYGR